MKKSRTTRACSSKGRDKNDGRSVGSQACKACTNLSAARTQIETDRISMSFTLLQLRKERKQPLLTKATERVAWTLDDRNLDSMHRQPALLVWWRTVFSPKTKSHPPSSQPLETLTPPAATLKLVNEPRHPDSPNQTRCRIPDAVFRLRANDFRLNHNKTRVVVFCVVLY